MAKRKAAREPLSAVEKQIRLKRSAIARMRDEKRAIEDECQRRCKKIEQRIADASKVIEAMERGRS